MDSLCCPIQLYVWVHVQIIEGQVRNYIESIRSSKFCLSPYGHGWGMRTTIYMAHGCVPVILQDHVYQVGVGVGVGGVGGG